jgi:hypothetical protein
MKLAAEATGTGANNVSNTMTLRNTAAARNAFRNGFSRARGLGIGCLMRAYSLEADLVSVFAGAGLESDFDSDDFDSDLDSEDFDSEEDELSEPLEEDSEDLESPPCDADDEGFFAPPSLPLA